MVISTAVDPVVSNPLVEAVVEWLNGVVDGVVLNRDRILAARWIFARLRDHGVRRVGVVWVIPAGVEDSSRLSESDMASRTERPVPNSRKK